MNGTLMMKAAGAVVAGALGLRLFLGVTLGEVAGGLSEGSAGWMWLSLLLGAVNAGLLFGLMYAGFGLGAGLLGAGFLGLSWVVAGYELLGSTGSVSITLGLLALGAGMWMRERPGWGPVGLAGVSLGMMGWLHPGAVVFSAFGAGWFARKARAAGLHPLKYSAGVIGLCWLVAFGGMAIWYAGSDGGPAMDERSVLMGTTFGERVLGYWSAGEMHSGPELGQLRGASGLLQVLPFPFAFTLGLAVAGLLLFMGSEWNRSGTAGADLAILLAGYVMAMFLASALLGHGAEGRLVILPVLYGFGALAVVRIDRLNQDGGLKAAGPWVGAALGLWFLFSLNRAEVPGSRFDRIMQDAVAAIQAGNFGEAEGLLLAAREETGAEGRLRVALVLDQIGATDKAMEEFSGLIEADPGFGGAYVERGRLLARKGLLGEAVGDFQRATEIYPERGDVWIMLAAAMQSQNRLQEAEMYYLRALHLMPDSADAMVGLGYVYVTRNRMDAAAEQFEMALRMRPGDPEATRGLQQVRAAGGRR